MSKPPITTRPVSDLAANAARLSIISGTLFVLLLGSLHLLEPEYDPTWRFISEYALGSFGWLMNLAFLSLACSLISAGVAIMTQTRTVAGYVGLAILGMSAIGLFIAGIFNTDSMDAGQAGATFSGNMHVLGASLDFTPVAALLLGFSLAYNQAWRPIRARLFISAGITLVATAAFFVTMPPDFQFGPGVLTGLAGRLLLVSYVGWLLTVGLQVLRLHRQAVGLSGQADNGQEREPTKEPVLVVAVSSADGRGKL